jgi:arginyl-tRNA synthetase
VIGPSELAEAVRKGLAAAGLPEVEPTFERPRHREHGDWSTNVALALAKRVGSKPRDVAQRLIEALPDLAEVERIEVAGPGFVNFHLAHDVLEETIRLVVEQAQGWGRAQPAKPHGRVNIEFVSANPTGPLHVGHGRQAVLGDALANLLSAGGWDVTREYYFNDAGNQMARFGASVDAVMRGEEPPEDGYHGSYIRDLAAELAAEEVGGEEVGEAAYQRMLGQITATLDRLGVRFDTYFGERTLHESGLIDEVIGRLRQAGHVYEADGAVWLRTTSLGDDKDRVLLRSDGTPTYFAADVAYLESKRSRGFDHLIYVLGADHHGYVQRLKAMASAEGMDPDRLESCCTSS